MTDPEYLSRPDEHLKPLVAESYDQAHAGRFGADELASASGLLSELAGDGSAVEFAVGTGRLALPLAATGTKVYGLDFSGPMLEQLRKKSGADQIEIAQGDMTETVMCTDAALVYLAFNTIGNLRTQAGQVACFQNASAHLRPGGRFLIEVGVPQLQRLAPGETLLPFDVSPHHLGFSEYIDRVNQIEISHHYYIDGDQARSVAGSFRYVWPAELDLMAQLAGMELEHRWAGWDREPFTGDSPAHVSVWRKT